MLNHARDRLIDRLRAAGCVLAEQEADLLLAHLAEDPGTDLEQLVRRREQGEPLEQLLGWAEFAGLRVSLEPGVFVPRHRTEWLVEQAAQRTAAGSLVLDLCCGTGALGLALAARVPDVHLVATDLDPAAVLAARRNLGPTADVFCGDLFAPLPTELRRSFAVIVANTPYVPTEAIALLPGEARDHEHRIALDGGADGLNLQRRVAAEAADWVAPGGVVLVETSTEQAKTSRDLFVAAGLAVEDAEDDGTVVIIATAASTPGWTHP